MPRILIKTIYTCGQCPYMEWEDDNSCSNNAGSSICTKWGKHISNNKNPDIPEWCPLPFKNE